SAADQVPLYIQQLRTQAVFAQSAFGVLQIKPDASGVFEFSLAKNNPRNAPVAAKTAVQQLLEANEKAATSTAGGQE
ncbi:MAG TPA: MSHA biogenesis protein MshI, partial [Cellvibrio sp.]